MIEIRPVAGLDEMYEVERVQHEVWGIADREIVPALHFIPAVAVGAILLGAFDDRRLVGFVYGFPGFEGERRIIHSDMLAVLPRYRGHGLGKRLKLAQRDAALAIGVTRITWTFDPQQAVNAHLNFNTLRATAGRYLRDFYGKTTSPLHRAGTDRLWVTWDLDVVASYAEAARISLGSDLRERFESAFAEGLIVTAFDRDKAEYVLSIRRVHR